MFLDPSPLRAVLEDPASDGPRRAYATWADQRGDIRGHFVELQLALAAKVRAHAPRAEWASLEEQANDLVARCGASWLRPLEKLLREGAIARPIFYRGFVESVEMTAGAVLAHARALRAIAPILHLRITRLREDPQALASPLLEGLVSLDLSRTDLDEGALERLAASPHVDKLRWLDLSTNRLTLRGLDALCASPALKELAYVNLTATGLPIPIADPDPTPAGRALEDRFGAIGWLHAPARFGRAYPPLPLAVEPS